MHPTLQQTLMNCLSFHHGQIDKSGVPYFNHPVRVMLRLGPDAPAVERHAALLHDVGEDCGVTTDILRDMGYDENVIAIFELVTKKESETHRQYIYRIVGSGNVGAMLVKLADLYDNSSEVRRERITDPIVREKVDSMIETRYKPAIRMMREVLGDLAATVISEEMEIEIAELEIPDGCA